MWEYSYAQTGRVWGGSGQHRRHQWIIYWHLLFLCVAIGMASLKYHGVASVFPVWKSSSDLFLKKHFISYLTGFCSIGSLDNPMLKLQAPQNN